MDAILKSQPEQRAREMATQVTTLDDLNGLMRAMMKTALERMLDTGMDVHLGRRIGRAGTNTPTPDTEATAAPDATQATPKNRRDGHSQKTVSGDMGGPQLRTPRDPDGTSESQLVAKGQRRLDGFDEKVLALYGKGMTTRDIQDIVKDLYGVEVSPTLVSEITADLDTEATAWRTRRPDAVRPIVYLDGIVACVDGRGGSPEAIRTAFPQTKVPLCIVHLVRAALKYVTDSDSREVAADPKVIYQSATVLEAEDALERFATTWGEKYPTIGKPWRSKGSDIITLFEFPAPVRKAIYTTNGIESVNSVIRKFTRNRKQYPNADRALKLVYLAIHEASKGWTMPIVGWKAALNHFAIVFEGRMPTRTDN